MKPMGLINQIYLVHASLAKYLSRTDHGQYDRARYYENPSVYKSDFATNVQKKATHSYSHLNLNSLTRWLLILLSSLMESADFQGFLVL